MKNVPSKSKPFDLKKMLKLLLASLLTVNLLQPVRGQLVAPPEKVIEYTREWTGERYPDGRPKIPDEMLERLKNIPIVPVWAVLRNKGFHNQYEGDWKMIHEDRPFVGQALTAVYQPNRPDYAERKRDEGHRQGMIGPTNSWPIDMLQEGDVYVADGYGKIIDGTLIGDNLGNAIYARSKTGVVFDASVRDLEGLEAIEGFNGFIRGWDPSAIKEMMLAGINVPIRIGRATVFPGDAVLAKREGVIFVPPHLLEEVLLSAEFTILRDAFGHQRLKEGKYTPGQIDVRWTDAIKADFRGWLDENPDKLPMPRQELDEYMKSINW